MANLIDKDYFVGEINIPDTDKTGVAERLDFFITKYEEDLLRKLLGNALYKAFKDGIAVAEDQIEQKWKDVRDGKDFTDYAERAQYWIGLKSATKKQSPIANYVYYWWLRDRVSQSTAVGEVQSKSESGEKVSPATKMCRAWNEMVKWAKDLFLFLDSNQDVYTDWIKINRCEWKAFFQPINPFNI